MRIHFKMRDIKINVSTKTNFITHNIKKKRDYKYKDDSNYSFNKINKQNKQISENINR